MALPFDKTWLVERYLTGLDLTDDNGVAYPAAFFTHSIDVALDWIRSQLDLPVTKQVITERHDHVFNDYRAWQWISLGKLPVLTSPQPTMKYKYNQTDVIIIPDDWIYLAEPTAGQLQIVPTMGSNLPLVHVVNGIPIWAGMASGGSRIPGWFEITYSAGWDDDKIPFDVQHLLGMFASRFALNTAGDLIAGAGVASFSIGADALHSSLNTTCFTGDTRILLADGAVAIRDLVERAEPFLVVSFDGTKIIATPAVLPRATVRLPVLEVGLTDGSKVHCSGNHLWRTASMGWVEAERLREGMQLVTAGLAVQVAGIRWTGRTEQLYDITVPLTSCFALESGAIVHNSSATNAGYGARIIQYEKEMKDLIPLLRRKYHGAADWEVA